MLGDGVLNSSPLPTNREICDRIPPSPARLISRRHPAWPLWCRIALLLILVSKRFYTYINIALAREFMVNHN